MSGSFGLLDTGFVPKSIPDIVTSLGTNLQAALGASIDLGPRSVWQKVLGAFAGELAECWEAGEDIFSSLSPDGAAGSALVDLAGVTGTLPLSPEPSSVVETCIGVTGTLVTQGRIFSVEGRTNTRFISQADVTLLAVTAWASSTAVALGDKRKNGGNVYLGTQAGTTASSGGPSGQGQTIVDGTAVWRWLGLGDGAADVTCFSEVLDAITAPAGTLSRIDAGTSGLNNVVNLEDADLGQPDETDPELRTRREVELRAQGNAALDSILARVSRVDGVKSCVVFENVTDTTDGNGVPPHAVETVVRLDAGPPANVEDLIRAAIFSVTAGGIRPYGQVSGTVVDAAGNNQTVGFSYLTEVPCWVHLDLGVTSDFPPDGVAQVMAALVQLETERLVGGYDLMATQALVYAFRVAGVFDATSASVGSSSPPGALSVTIGPRQIATLDTSRMTVTATPRTP